MAERPENGTDDVTVGVSQSDLPEYSGSVSFVASHPLINSLTEEQIDHLLTCFSEIGGDLLRAVVRDYAFPGNNFFVTFVQGLRNHSMERNRQQSRRARCSWLIGGDSVEST